MGRGAGGYAQVVRIHVALTPKMLLEPATHAIAVVDVLRATTSLVAMFDRGLSRAIVAETLRDARKLSLEKLSLLCGESKGLPLAGFDHGNSPAEFASLTLKNKSAVLWTTNGTRALAAAAQAPFVAAAALTNRRAASRRLVAEAERRSIDVQVLCAGTERGTAFALEDTAVAGALVDEMMALAPAARLSDSAWAARHLWRFYRGEASRAFRHAAHGRALAALGFDHDLEYAAQVDVSDVVPLLAIEDGLKTMRVARRT
jgi:2-phosphosulfolactate phosphatase